MDGQKDTTAQWLPTATGQYDQFWTGTSRVYNGFTGVRRNKGNSKLCLFVQSLLTVISSVLRCFCLFYYL